MMHLTARQRDVAKLVADGLTDKEIAAELDIAYNTVRIHVAAIAFNLGFYRGNARVLIANWYRTKADAA